MTLSGVFPGLPWSPSFSTQFPAFAMEPELPENQLLVDPEADPMARAKEYSFSIKVFASTSGNEWEDISRSITAVGPLWQGEIAPSVYGWSLQLSGINYNAALLSPGFWIKLSVTINTREISYYRESYLRGRIMPGPIQFAYLSSAWTIQVVDNLSYLSRKKAPVFSVGSQNIATNAGVDVDSETDPLAVAGEGEFYGQPPLGADQAVDGDINSLWISTLSPDPTTVLSYLPYEDWRYDSSIILNELYYKGYSVSSAKDQWFEVVKSSPNPEPDQARFLTRSGAIQVSNISFARPDGAPGNYGSLNTKSVWWGIVAYDAEYFNRLWGNNSSAPVTEFKNARYSFSGSVEPETFNFNLDGQGDFLAMCHAGSVEKGDWRTYAVVDGPKMRRFDKGFFNTDVRGGSFTVRLTKEWTADELAGCFIRGTRDAGIFYAFFEWNCCRRIHGNSVSVPSTGHPGYYDTVISVDYGWQNYATDHDEDDRPMQNQSLIIRPWPEYALEQYGDDGNWIDGGYGWQWNNTSTNYADFNMLPAITAGRSYRRIRDGWHKDYNGQSGSDWQMWPPAGRHTWIADNSPQPGSTSGYGLDGNCPWIMVSPPAMSVLLSSPLNDGDDTIHVESTDGLLQATRASTKQAVVGLTVTPVSYVLKTATTIALENAWDQGLVPVGTSVYQYESSVGTDVWPVVWLVIKRRAVPSNTPDLLRVIKSAQIFVSYQDNPLLPGEEDWQESWDSATNPDGNPVFSISGNTTATTHTFQFSAPAFPLGYARPKHILVLIRAMSDLTRGRINEIEIIPVQSSVLGLQNSTIGEFFSYVLLALGVSSDNIDISEASTALIGSFSTDTSQYLDVISDLAVRTGQIVWNSLGTWTRVLYHPNWPTAPLMTPWIIADNYRLSSLTTGVSISDLEVSPYTGYPVSQVQVTVRDAEGNTAIGVHPPYPLTLGEIVVDPVIRTAAIENAGDIARMIFSEMTAYKLTVTISGVAPWARPGPYAVRMDCLLPDGTLIDGIYYISSAEHQIQLGDMESPRQWITKLELTKVIGGAS